MSVGGIDAYVGLSVDCAEVSEYGDGIGAT